MRIVQTLLVGVLAVLLLGILVVVNPSLMPLSWRSAFGMAPSHHVLATPSGQYKFLDIQPGTKNVPVTYDGCQPLHYVVNFAGAPQSDPKASYVFSAVREISKVSGLKFVYDGTSDRRPAWHGWMTGGQILIAFADADEVPQMATADGIARSHPVQRTGKTVYASGQVTLQSTDFGRILDRPGGYAEARAIVMHELGHVLGLDHVADPGEIMFGRHVRVTELGPGDRTGLKILGAGPCY